MTNTLRPILSTLICVLFAACGSKSNSGSQQADEPIFGVYKFDTKGKVQIQLNADSTAESDIWNTNLQKTTAIKAVNNHGAFTFRNDSIFINGESGHQAKSKFVIGWYLLFPYRLHHL